MSESEKHPKRVFVKRVMDLEIRLSYFDRIKNTVPGSMLETGVFPEEAPGPDYVYEDPGSSCAVWSCPCVTPTNDLVHAQNISTRLLRHPSCAPSGQRHRFPRPKTS